MYHRSRQHSGGGTPTIKELTDASSARSISRPLLHNGRRELIRATPWETSSCFPVRSDGPVTVHIRYVPLMILMLINDRWSFGMALHIRIRQWY